MGNSKYFKIDTIEQFKVLRYININFEAGALELELLDRYSILGMDKYNECMIFYYDKHTDKVKASTPEEFKRETERIRENEQ